MGELPSPEEEVGTIVTRLPRYVLLSEDEESREEVEDDLPPAQHWTVLSPMQ